MSLLPLANSQLVAVPEIPSSNDLATTQTLPPFLRSIFVEGLSVIVEQAKGAYQQNFTSLQTNTEQLTSSIGESAAKANQLRTKMDEYSQATETIHQIQTNLNLRFDTSNYNVNMLEMHTRQEQLFQERSMLEQKKNENQVELDKLSNEILQWQSITTQFGLPPLEIRTSEKRRLENSSDETSEEAANLGSNSTSSSSVATSQDSKRARIDSSDRASSHFSSHNESDRPNRFSHASSSTNDRSYTSSSRSNDRFNSSSSRSDSYSNSRSNDRYNSDSSTRSDTPFIRDYNFKGKQRENTSKN